MKKLSLTILIICLTLLSCNNDDSESRKEEDNAKLFKMRKELLVLSESEVRECTNIDEWAYIKVGDACDGEINIIYSKKINTTEFLKKAAEYKKSLETYSKKWGSTCGEVLVYWGKPTGFDCYNGKPILLYFNKKIPD